MNLVTLSSPSNLGLLKSNQHQNGGVFPVRLNTGEVTICMRQGSEIIGYKYISSTGTWRQYWNEYVFPQEGDYPLERYPWMITNKLIPNENIVLLSHPDGLKIYQFVPSKPGLKFLAEDGRFHEAQGQACTWGYFYPDKNEIGVITHNGMKVDFYVLAQAELQDIRTDLLSVLDRNLSVTQTWNAENTNIFSTQLHHNNPSAIGLLTTSGLEFYQFNANHTLEKALRTSEIRKIDSNNQAYYSHLFFGNFTHQKFQDILLLNNSGLFTYQYNGSRFDYTFLNHHTGFKQTHGWQPQYSKSIRVFDINGDNFDDILFTNVQGLMALSFNTTTNSWTTLLDPEQLFPAQRYATVVGTLSPSPPEIVQPSLFLLDPDGNLQWAKVVPAPVITPTIQTTTTVSVSTATHSSGQRIETRNTPIPEQTRREVFLEKPTLLWAEQWDDGFLKGAVNPASGQVDLNIPLVDIFQASGWKLQLNLLYNSKVRTASLLGIGWSLSVTEDYIFVDRRGSIYFEDAQYHLVTQGRPQFLKLLAKENEFCRFKLAEVPGGEQIDIVYNQLKQQWIIKNEAEQITYGAASHGEAQSAQRWSLSWPNWRGPGCSKETLQPFILAWYLNKRVDMNTQKTLFYYYEKDSATVAHRQFDTAIRLKAISDGQLMWLKFDYAPKGTSEYKSFNPVDGDGNIEFPTPLTQSHYLQGYNLTAATYSQILKFNYEVNNEKRVLISIQQQVSSKTEPVLQFHYQTILENWVLQSCKLHAKGSTVNFDYQTSEPPVNLITHYYPYQENSKITYGPDFTIMSSNSTANQVILRIMNRYMTQTNADCLVDKGFTCPTASKVQDYTVQPYEDSFRVLIESDTKRELHFFNRHHNQTWYNNHTALSFSKEALVRFSEKLIVAAESKNVRVFKNVDNQSHWTEQTLITEQAILSLALHNRLIVGYDGYKLWLFYPESDNFWKTKILKPNMIDRSSSILTSFDMESEARQQISTALNQRNLQIFNNFILFNSLGQDNNQLYSNITLLLLDSEYNVVKNQTYKIKERSINELTYEYKNDDSIYKINCVEENGLFKAQVTAISGKIISDIIKKFDITNKNIRDDIINGKDGRVTDLMKKVNQRKEFEQFFKTDFWFNQLSSYVAQIGENGALIGDDLLLRNTGTEWEKKESLPKAQTSLLGKNFILESANDGKLYKLFKQDNNQSKTGDSLWDLELNKPGQIIIAYPAHIFYHPKPDLIIVITFEDGQTLGRNHTFEDEQLFTGGDLINLITVANSSSNTEDIVKRQEFRVRPVFSLLPPKTQSFVHQQILAANSTQRITAYKRSYKPDKARSMYNETITIIPGNNTEVYGWHELTRSFYKGNITISERWFNSDGEQAVKPPGTKTAKQSVDTTPFKPNPSLLLDRSDKWLISDFSPYSLESEMVAYYGFEPYENNQINGKVSNTTVKYWNIKGAQVIRHHFAFTGESYLQLKKSFPDNLSYFEGAFQPQNQRMTYLATCWIRCNTVPTLETPVPYLKAIVNTTGGQKVISLMAKVKRQLGDWSYLELPLNLISLKQIYEDYYNYIENPQIKNMLPLPDKVNFQITLRVETHSDETLDLDHIRFTPITLDFQAAVYHPTIGRPTSIIQANGLVGRTIYNHLHREIATIDYEGQIVEFSTSSRTGKLVPDPRGSLINPQPNIINFEPEYGSYENFDASTWRSRWIMDNPAAWTTAPGQLCHKQSGRHQIKPNQHLFDDTNAALRFYFILQEPQSLFSLNWNGIGSLNLTRQLDNSTNLALPNGQFITTLPSAGELIVMVEQNYLGLWIDGVLLIDQAFPVIGPLTVDLLSPWSSFVLEVQGRVVIEDCLTMNRPHVTIEYFNSFSEKTQVIHLVDSQTAQVSETLYDAVGREAITTKTTEIKRDESQSLLAYRSHFARNKDHNDPQSVWHTGILQGEIDQFNVADKGYAYTRTEYASNPLNRATVLGLPGPDFSITGPYATKMSENSNLAFLYNLYPPNKGYLQKVEYTPNGSMRIMVFDRHNNKVAKYIRALNCNHLLSTYEYDEENRLIKILPPLYHEKVNTTGKLTALQLEEAYLSTEEKQWQQALATFFTYDKYGNLIRKVTPDSGTTEYVYDAFGLKRFMISLDALKKPKNIIYFKYNSNKQLINTGHVNVTLSINDLRLLSNNDYIPYAEEYQKFDHSNNHFDPILRGRVKEYITQNNGKVVVEKLLFDTKNQVISKKTILSPANPDLPNTIRKEYFRGKVQKLIYPIIFNDQPLHLVHTYDKLGQLIGLGIFDNPEYFAKFTYHATGQLATEQYQPNRPHSFTRNYEYNSPGFLEKISDSFLTEDITYTSKGYGQDGYGDGMVMQMAFNASWSRNSDKRWFEILDSDLGGQHSPLCVKALKRTGHLSENNQPIKLFLRDAETDFPLLCDGETSHRIAKLLAEKQKPTYYGHRNAYGSHQELVQSKYFTESTENLATPLQPNSFSKEIPELTKQQSQHIWDILINANFIVASQLIHDQSAAIGYPGRSFFRTTDLKNDLAALNGSYPIFEEPIQRLILSQISQQQILTTSEFEEVFLRWRGLDSFSSKVMVKARKDEARPLIQMLLNKGYLPTQKTDFTGPLNRNFTAALHQYTIFIPKIVQTLSLHFTHALGKTSFDIESFDIDANGNHRIFYTGFHRYELAYNNANNQIKNIKRNLASTEKHEDNTDKPMQLNLYQVFSMQHDERGNVIQALHKNIEHIEYHPVSQRAVKIQLTDLRFLHFHYDAQGERILKQVFDTNGKISHETYYLRDEKGRVLVDQQIKYVDGKTQKITTAYLYGPRGLLGFIRNNNFYSVTTDHSGSVRLVIKDGQVVAAYDYLPYGSLMRSFGYDPQAHIAYRYTGQEWDEETDLYNYHARFYDPSIGRFYQVDPRAQYDSPYKYAGNSPLSIIDPDGEFAILTAMLLGGLIGMYLGGLTVNKRLNPLDWDFHDLDTWKGMGMGLVVGALAGLAFEALAGAIPVLLGISVKRGAQALGFGFAYLKAAGLNRNWDPTKWKWDRPDTWDSLLEGFITGSKIPGRIAELKNLIITGDAAVLLKNFIRSKTDIGQCAIEKIFLASRYTIVGGKAYKHTADATGKTAFWDWDWSDPKTWSELVDAFNDGLSRTREIMKRNYRVNRLQKEINVGQYLYSGQGNLKLNAILKDVRNPLFQTASRIVIAYFMDSLDNEDFDVDKLKLNVLSTYEGLLNSVYYGKDISKTLQYLQASKIEKPTDIMGYIADEDRLKNWSTEVSSALGYTHKNLFQNLMKQAFAANTIWLSKLANEPILVRKNVETFFKEGLTKWQRGENNPPYELQRLILNETNLQRQEDSELMKWIADTEAVLRMQQEVIPEEKNVAFLKCNHAGQREHSASACFSTSVDNTKDTKQLQEFTPIVSVFHNNGNNEQAIISEVLEKEFINHTSTTKPHQNSQASVPRNSNNQASVLKGLNSNVGQSDHNNMKPEHNTKNLTSGGRKKRSLDSSLTLSTEKPITLGKVEKFDTSTDNTSVSFSGSNKLQFWPAILLKGIRTQISSILFSNWFSSWRTEAYDKFPVVNSLQSELPAVEQQLLRVDGVCQTLRNPKEDLHFHEQLNVNRPFSGPSESNNLNYWTECIDLNGLLVWGNLLARKWTKNKPKSFNLTSYSDGTDIISGINASNLVDTFLDAVANHSQACGFEPSMVEFLHSPELYYEVTEKTHKILASGELEAIPKLLYGVIQQNIRKIVTESTQRQANHLLEKMKVEILNLQAQLIQEEHDEE